MTNIYSENKIEMFCTSQPFYWLCGAAAFAFWYFNLNFIGVAFLFVLAAFIFSLCRDTKAGILVLTLAFFCISATGLSIATHYAWAITFILPIIGGVINVVRFRPKFVFKGFTLAAVLTILPWLIMGVGMPDRQPLRVLACIGVYVILILVYLFFNLTAQKEGLTHSFMHFMLIIATVLALQIFVYYLRLGKEVDLLEVWDIIAINVGWGGQNNISTLLSLTMPAAFYFAVKSKRAGGLFIVYGGILYFAVLLTCSRGAAGAATLFMPVLIIYALIKSKNKISILAGVLAIIVAAMIIYARFDGIIYMLFGRFIKLGLTGNGRSELYAEGLSLFLRRPVLGAGFDYISQLYYSLIPHSQGPAYYHSTFIQILASFGLFGAMAYMYFYYWRYRLVFTDFDFAKCIMLIGMLMFELYNMIDTNFFQPQGFMIMLFMSLVMEKSLDKGQTTPLIFKAVNRCPLRARGKNKAQAVSPR